MYNPCSSVLCERPTHAEGRLVLSVERERRLLRLRFRLSENKPKTALLELGEDADVLIVIARNKTAASEMQTDHHISLVRRPDHVCPSPCPVSKQIGACAPHTRLLHIRMSHAIIQETSRQLGRRYAPDLVQPALCRTDRSLSALGNSLAESVEDGTPLSSLELETYARAFAGFVVSRYLKDGAGPKATGGLSKASLRKVLHLAESRFEQEVSLLDLASEAGLSVSHFCREFKRAMSITPMQHLMHVRCKEAMRRLEDPGQTLTRIAMDCGFGNSQTFSRSFRKIVGMLPSEYRAMQLRTV